MTENKATQRPHSAFEEAALFFPGTPDQASSRSDQLKRWATSETLPLLIPRVWGCHALPSAMTRRQRPSTPPEAIWLR